MRELQGHVTEEWLNAWRDGLLKREEEYVMLAHIGHCEYCAERFAQMLEDNPIQPPAYLREEILERSKCPDVQTARKVYQTSRQMRLLLYSLKVGLAVATSLFLLFGTSRIDSELLRAEWKQADIIRSSVAEEQDERNGSVSGYLQQLTERLFYMYEEELYD